jgi:hypothetical protein
MMLKYLQKVIRRKTFKKLVFMASRRSIMKIEGSGFISQRHGSADPDPDPHKNFLDPQHFFLHFFFDNKIPYSL